MTNLEYFYGKPLKLNDKLEIIHPKVKDIINIGYDLYMKYFSILVTTKYDIADILWFENHIWYEDINNDWDFFVQRALSNKETHPVRIKQSDSIIDIEMDSLFIGESFRNALNYFLSLNCYYIVLQIKKNENKQTILLTVNKDENGYYIDENSVKFTEHYYHLMLDFLKNIHWISDDYEFTHGGNKRAKKYILENDYKKRKKKHKSLIDLQSIISSLVVKGQNYFAILNYPVFVVYELYYRLLKIDSYDNTTNAIYSGCYDTKKHPINWDKINWTSIIRKP